MEGMGNQMFQYALYQALLAQGKEVKLDRARYTHIDNKRKCILDYECFELKYRLCSSKEARQYMLGTGMTARVLMRVFGDKSTHYYEKSEYEYDPYVMQLQEGYLDGFWQSWKYFENIELQIRKLFKFKSKLSEKNKLFVNQIRGTNSVAVHVRRGDYLKLEAIYGNICTIEYYNRAIDVINQTIEHPTFYFFSNDMEWTRSIFGCKENYIYVEGNGEDSGDIDMQLMSECRHQIIANSSFSWWAAYLNDNVQKKVICPERWVNTKMTPDVYCRDWIKI